MITTADIVDTAVKIGLGAIISGVVTLVVLKLNYNKERSQRRRELLEEVAQHAAKVDRAGLRYWQTISWGSYTPDEQKTLENINEETTAAATSVQATLWLLGENRCCELFKEYDDVIWEIPEDPVKSNEEFQKAREPIRKKRMAFFAELNKTYRKL
jgi:hypothetical protein